MSTPGPWRVGTKVGRTIYRSPSGGPEALIGVMDEVDDAVLAAAAPEMLAALILARRAFSQMGTSGAASDAVRAAIKTATTPWSPSR